ncbi:MAG: NAD(P)H-dependent oxidoreductase subunit E [Acidimicrobiales bacterium]|jgi:formate dehydrogenase subunit gamma
MEWGARCSYQPFSPERAADVIAMRSSERGPLLEILHDLQTTFGYLDPAATPLVAEALNLSQAEVYGVISFYTDLRTEAPGRRILQICRAEACQSMGADQLCSHVRERLGVDFGSTTPDGGITLLEVFCLGNCALSPAALADGNLLGRLDATSLDELIDNAELSP